MSEEDKPKTEAEYYLQHHHKTIERIYEEAFEFVNDLDARAIQLLQLSSESDDDDEPSSESLIRSAIAHAHMSEGVRQFREQHLRPVWKYGCMATAWEAYESQVLKQEVDDDDHARRVEVNHNLSLPTDDTVVVHIGELDLVGIPLIRHAIHSSTVDRDYRMEALDALDRLEAADYLTEKAFGVISYIGDGSDWAVGSKGWLAARDWILSYQVWLSSGSSNDRDEGMTI